MKYFTLQELTKSDTARAHNIDNTPNEEQARNLISLVENVLDPIREQYGKPLKVNSGFRCLKLNSILKNASKTSSHMQGQAADITTGSKSGNKELYHMIKRMVDENKLTLDQCINECRGGSSWQWIHIGNGPRKRNQFFNLSND